MEIILFISINVITIIVTFIIIIQTGLNKGNGKIWLHCVVLVKYECALIIIIIIVIDI